MEVLILSKPFFRKQDDSTRINDRIRVPQVRLITETGEAAGVVATPEALRRAQEAGLDLVEVSATAEPPVCRIMDFGKFKYEKSKKQKEAKKKQHIVHLKEIKLHPKTDDHDYNFKMQHARDFLIRGDRVKATVVFRGREITHTEFGRELLDKLDKDLADLSQIEISAKMEGKNMISIYLPDKLKTKEVQRKMDIEKKRADAEEALAKAASEKETPVSASPELQ